MKHFMDDEFKCIKKAYLFDLLPEKEQDQLIQYMKSIFPKNFLKLIYVLKRKYRIDKIDYFLKKFFKNLEQQFETTRCYVETHDILSDKELENIEKAILKKFKIEKMFFRYSVNKDLLCGVRFRFNYMMYDLSFQNILRQIEERAKKRIQKEEFIINECRDKEYN